MDNAEIAQRIDSLERRTQTQTRALHHLCLQLHIQLYPEEHSIHARRATLNKLADTIAQLPSGDYERI